MCPLFLFTRGNGRLGRSCRICQPTAKKECIGLGIHYSEHMHLMPLRQRLTNTLIPACDMDVNPKLMINVQSDAMLLNDTKLHYSSTPTVWFFHRTSFVRSQSCVNNIFSDEKYKQHRVHVQSVGFPCCDTSCRQRSCFRENNAPHPTVHW